MAVTLQSLFDIAVSNISSICSNILNFSSISSEFKSGYTREFNHNRSKCTVTIANPVSQVNTSQVSSQFSTFLSDNGFSDMSKELSSGEIISYYILVAVFTSARVNYVASQFSIDTYICYNNNNNKVTYDFDSAVISAVDNEIILASDGLISSYYFQKIINQNIKANSIQYNFVMTGYAYKDGYIPTGNVDVDNTTPAIVYVPSQYLINLVSSSVSQTVLQNHPSGGRSSSSGYLKFTINTSSKNYTDAYLIVECGFRLPGYKNSYSVCWSWELNSTSDIYSNSLPWSFSASPNTISGRQEIARFALSKSGSLTFNLAYCFNYWTDGSGDTSSPQTIYVYYKVINAYGESEYIEKTFRV